MHIFFLSTSTSHPDFTLPLQATVISSQLFTVSAAADAILHVESVVDGPAAPKPHSQVVMETCGTGVSCSGRDSISGSSCACASGATLIPRPSRAHDLVTMAEVDSGRLTSLGRDTTGVGSVSRGARAKPYSLGRSLRPSSTGGTVSISFYTC